MDLTIFNHVLLHHSVTIRDHPATIELRPENWTAQSGDFLVISLAGKRRKDCGGIEVFRPANAVILKRVDDGLGVQDVCRKAGLSQQTYYRWRQKYGGLMPSEIRRLKQLEDENRRLKQIVADLSLDKAMLEDVLQESCSVCEGAWLGR